MEEKKSQVRDLLEDILRSDLKIETKSSLIENIEEKDLAVEELSRIRNEVLYNKILSKPLISGNDLMRLPSEPNDYLIEKFLWKGSILILVGQEKACKSIVTSQMCMAMTCGEQFLGCFDVARQLKVLYIQAEGSVAETKERLIKATKDAGLKWNPDNWRHYSPSFLCMDTEEGFKDVERRLDQDGFVPDVIVYDPLYTLVTPGKSLNDDNLIRPFCGNVRRLNDKYKCASIIVHHEHRPKLDKFNNKLEEGDNAIYGSSMLKNFASHVIRVSITNDRGNPVAAEKEDVENKYRKLTCSTQRSGNVLDKIVLRLNQNPLMFEVMTPKPTGSTRTIILECIKNKGKIAPCELATETGFAESTVRNCIGDLKREKKIKIHSKESHKVYYCIN